MFPCRKKSTNETDVSLAKILTIIPYDFFPPKYGGALRCFYILREMAKFHDITLLTVQPEEVFRTKCDFVFPSNVHIISTANEKGYRTIFNLFPDRLAHAVNSRILKRSLFEKGNLYLLKTFPVLKRLLTENEFDFVLYENLESFSVLNNHIRRLAPQVSHLYDAHNVDSELWLQLYKTEGKPELKDYAISALEVEKQLHQTVSLCLACSEIDRQKLDNLNGGMLNLSVVPNGVDTEDRQYDPNKEKHQIPNILFCGTLDYTPNMRGLLWFYESVFPLIRKQRSDLTLTIIGKMNTPGPYENLKSDAAVRFVGPVESVQPYYKGSSLLIVPLLSGSGTRLKILEAMSMGNPVVSTSIGAEGLSLEDGRQIRLADDPESFATAVLNLLEDKDLFERQRQEAHLMVIDHYDWKIIGQRINSNLSRLLKQVTNGDYA